MTRVRRAETLDVPLVIEFYVIRKHVHLLPRNRLVLAERFRNLLDIRFIRRDHDVAVHTDVEGRYRRVVRPLRGRMAVQTRDFISTRMQLVRERNRLFGRIAPIVTDRTPLQVAAGQRDERGEQRRRLQKRESFHDTPQRQDMICR